MQIQAKAQLIGAIISHLRFAATQQKKQFNEGDIFFSLCFKSDDELEKIAKLSGC
jgi:hypothetical protein